MTEWNDPASGKGASVSNETDGRHRGNVSSRSSGRPFYVSRDSKQSFHWTSTYDSTVGAVCFSIQNISTTKDLYIEEIHVSALTNCGWDFYLKETGDTPAGTTLASFNLNRFGVDSSDIAAFGNAAVTGITNTTTGRFLNLRSGPNEHVSHLFDGGLILGRNDSFNIQIAGLTAGGSAAHFVTCHGVFE